jgi:hypothetical protein
MTRETEEKPKESHPQDPTLERPSNILVDPMGSPRLPSAQRGDEASPMAFVVVSLLSNTDDRIAALEEAHGEPDSVHVICVEGRVDEAGYDTVRTVNRPDDITGLSMRIGEVLSEVHDDDVYLYFDDITSLLQYSDLNTAYRFLNVLTGRIDAADAVAYFGATPGAHDERTVNTLRNLFDGTVGEFS